jgi:hypothetical protein
MKRAMLVLMAILTVVLAAEPRGMTQREIPADGAVVVVQPQALLNLPEPVMMDNPKLDTDTWTPVTTLPQELMLPAGAQAGVRFNHLTSSGEVFYSQGELLPQSVFAVAKAPSWIQSQLRSMLLQLQPDRQILFADVINNAGDPIVDEVAFCVATSSPEYLNSSFALPQLFLENALNIYAIANELPYVDIFDTGNSASGGDYWSTTRYWKKDEGGQMVQVSVPREIYYWFLVQPKVTDEIAAYIDPALVENNSTHSNNIVAPPTGKHWRSYFYSVDDGTHPVLSDTLQLCQSVFNRDGSPGDVIHAITWWINQNMSFTSNTERPHQPMRILAKHFGRCGEYADISAAVARTALIPCTNISSISTDHTWNEFWEGDWVSWEPVNGYLNGPLVYENGWGKVFGSVFMERCDGMFTPVTERYSEGLATINIQVLDENQTLVDGARVILAIFDTAPRFDCQLYTDNNGMVSFPVGENRDYRARVETSFGLYPANPGTYAQLVSNSVSGETYNYQFVIESPLNLPSIETITPPVDTDIDYSFAAVVSSPAYYVTGKALWDDIDVLGTLPHWYVRKDLPGDVSFLVTDTDNLLFYQIDNWCSAVMAAGPYQNISAFYSIKADQDWYGFLDNSHREGNAVLLSGTMALNQWSSPVQDPQVPPVTFSLSSPMPNPARTKASFGIATPYSGDISLRIYNLRGQLIRILDERDKPAGRFELTWDLKDLRGEAVPDGVYLVRANANGLVQDSRLVIIR